MLLCCGDMIPPGVGWLLRYAPAPRILAAEVARYTWQDSSQLTTVARPNRWGCPESGRQRLRLIAPRSTLDNRSAGPLAMT
jgi:hypothetical protein